MMASRPQTALRPTCILNGKSVHLQAAMRHIPRISGEFGAETQVLVTKRGTVRNNLRSITRKVRKNCATICGKIPQKLRSNSAPLALPPSGTA
jgi:hypothetical protein